MVRIKRRDIGGSGDKKDFRIKALEEENTALKQHIVELERLNKNAVADKEKLFEEMDLLAEELETAEDELNSRD